ncbi:MAG: hypothetical protein J5733_03075 [Bacteroidaceae bacterium]|nr:hypothetical protein [Bacteroidaceae bacterium]
MEQKQIDEKFKFLIKKAERFNAMVAKAYVDCQTDEVYLDRSSTCVGLPEYISLLSWKREDTSITFSVMEGEFSYYEGKDKRHVSEWRIYVDKDEDGEEYFEGAFEFCVDLDYMKRCVRSGIRFWQSEDPDRFLEKDDDDD